MKKLFLILGCLFVVPILSGCSWQKKATTTTDTTAGVATDTADTTGATDTTASATATTDTSSTQTEPSSGSVTTEITIVSTAAKTYNDNLQKANQNAVATIADNIFCNVTIEYPAQGTYSIATESFFFTSANASLKDWYWVVQFDQIENVRRELFAARRDFKDISCAKPDQALKVSFAEAVEKAVSNGALTALDSQDAARVKIYLTKDSTDIFWQITVFSTTGQTLASVKVNSSNGYVDTQSTASASTAATATAGTY